MFTKKISKEPYELQIRGKGSEFLVCFDDVEKCKFRFYFSDILRGILKVSFTLKGKKLVNKVTYACHEGKVENKTALSIKTLKLHAICENNFEINSVIF